MSTISTVAVLDVPLAAIDYDRAVAQAMQWARDGAAPRAIAAANTHMVTLARGDASFRAALAHFDLLLPDGMPLVWVMNRRLRPKLRDRVYGPTFMLRCLEATRGPEFSHFLLGGSEDLLAALQKTLTARMPDLRFAGGYAPPFGEWPPEEDARIIERIRQSGAQFVWVGLGCPKQERWIARHKAQLPPGVYAAVGAAFAFHAGRVKQAPAWMQRAGLEWLFRIAVEPRRLWRRYLVFNTLFVWYLVAEMLRASPPPRRPTSV